MAYFAPYIDASGIHMPTYEDRLEALCDSYREIFGVEAELSAAVPDYQLLSVFAKALDDTSALVVQDFASRNPGYASGAALDLLLPQYGLVRAAGETDAEARTRIRQSLAGRSAAMEDSLLAAVKACRYVRVLDGGNQEAISAAVPSAVFNTIDNLGLGEPLNVPQLYGIAYAADPSIANTFVVTDIQVSPVGASSVIRDVVPCDWNQKVSTLRNGGVSLWWS